MATSRFGERFNQLRDASEDYETVRALAYLGVFHALTAGPMTLEEVAAAVEAVPRRLRTYLDLAALGGFLVRQGDRFALRADDVAFFDPDNPDGFSTASPDFAKLNRTRARQLDILRGGPHIEAAGSGGAVDQAERDHFLQMIHRVSLRSAEVLASLLPREGVRRVVDLGCGAGTYSFSVLESRPDARAVLIDQESARPTVSALSRQRGLQARVDFRAIDFLRGDFGRGYDLAIMSNVIHGMSPEDNLKLLRAVAGSLAPGGRVAVKDYGVAPDRSGPEWGLRFAQQMALATAAGDVYPAMDVVSWCEEAGLQHEATHGLDGSSYLVVARRG